MIQYSAGSKVAGKTCQELAPLDRQQSASHLSRLALIGTLSPDYSHLSVIMQSHESYTIVGCRQERTNN